MSNFNFRVLLETIEGNKTSYISISGSNTSLPITTSFVDTSVDLVLSSSQTLDRINGAISCSYQNFVDFSGSDFNINKNFTDNKLLSASLEGSADTGSIDFDALDTEYDRLLRYKFFGEKVCNVLGLPNAQWVYVDQVRFPADDESNIFQGNIDVNNAFISDTLTFANNANINSDIPFYIDTGSDRYIKFIDTRGTGNASLIFGYDKDNDAYEINASENTTFNITNLNNLTVDTINAAQVLSTTTTTQNEVVTSFQNMVVTGSMIVSGSESNEPLLRVGGNVSASGFVSASDLVINGNSSFSGDITVGGSVTAQEFITQIITTAEGGNTFGNSIDDVQTLTGSVNITGSLNLPDNTRIKLGNQPDLQIYHNGDNSVISDTGAGELLINGSAIRVRDGNDGGTIALFTQGAGTELRHDNVKKFETTNDGVIVTGHITASGDISASGIITAKQYNLSQSVALSFLDNSQVFGDLVYQNTYLGPAHTFGGPITSSFNISASGNIIAATVDTPQIFNTGLKVGRDSQNLIDFSSDNTIVFRVNNGNEITLVNNIFRPTSNDGIALGSGTNTWSDLFLADGAVISFNNSELSIQQNNKQLEFSGMDGTKFVGHITSSGNISGSSATTASFGKGFFGGKVGIGTINPAANLHINNSSGETTLLLTGQGGNPADAASIRLSEQSDGNNYIELKYDGSTNILSFDSNNQNDMLSIDRTNNRVFTGDSTSFKVGSHITASGNISSSGNITAVSMSGDGSGLTGVTGEWDGTIDGDAQITGSLVVTQHITSSNISASGHLKVEQILFDGPRFSEANSIKFQNLSQLSSSKTAGLMWDFPNDDAYIYAHQSSSDVTNFVFEQRDNTTSDKFIFWFNDYRGSGSDSFPLEMRGDRFVVNNIYDRAVTYHKDTHNQMNMKSNNVDFYLIKSGSTSVSRNNSLIFGDVSDSQVTINGQITASGNISASGGQITAKKFIAQKNAEGTGGYGFREGRDDTGMYEQDFSVAISAPENVLIHIDSNNNNDDDTAPRQFAVLRNGDVIDSNPNDNQPVFQVFEDGRTLFHSGSVNGITFNNEGHITASGDISASGLGFFGGSIGVNGVSQSLSTFTTYPGLHIKHSDTNGGPVGSQNILIGGTEDNNPTNAKLKMYLDGDHDGVLTTYQYGSSLKLKAGVSGSSFKNNWSQILLQDTGTTMGAPAGFIQFWTSGSQRAVIDDSGKFGIGTTNPSETLEVSGSGIKLSNGPSDSTLKFFRNGAETGRISSADSTLHIRAQNNKSVRISDDSSNSGIVVRDGGNVGIGKVTATTQLEVEGDISASGALMGLTHITASNNIIINDGSRTIELDINNGSNEPEIKASGATLQINKSNGVDTNFDNGTLYIDASENSVGIGETAPDDKLHIKQGDIRIETATNAEQGIHFYEGTVERARIDFDSSTNNDLSIKTYDNDSTQVDRLTIKTSQAATAVGIGTTSPDYTLDVAGDVGIDKFIYHNGDDNTFLKFQDSEDNIQLSAGGSHLNFTSTGLGIGVTAVSSNKLQVAGNVSSSGFISTKSHITASGNISASGDDHFLGGRLNIHSTANNRSHLVVKDLELQTGLSYLIDSNQHGDFHLDRDSVDKIRINTYWPTQIDNDSYETFGGLILGSDADRGDKTGFGLYVSAGPDSGSIYTKERVFIGVGGATGSNDMLSVGGNITTTSHITASGNISGSSTSTLSIGNITNVTNITSSGNLIFSGSGVGSVQDRGVYFAKSSGNVSYIRSLNSKGGEIEIGSDNRIIFNETDNDVSRMEIDTNTGKVGIGTSTPENNDALLTVTGKISASDDFDIANEARIRFASSAGVYSDDGSLRRASGEAIRFRYDKNAFIFDAVENDNWEIRNSDDSPVFRVNTNNGTSIFSGSAGTFVALNHSNGRVGIGTTSPTRKLNVVETSANKAANFTSLADSIITVQSTDGTTGITFKDDAAEQELFFRGNKNAFYIENPTKLGLGTNDPSEILDVVGNIKARDKITSTTFESGFAGSGFRIETGSSGTLFTVDDLTVRGKMSVFELLIHQIRATNGSLFVSNTGKILSASLSSVDNHYSMSFDTGSGYGHSFLVGDLVRAQRFVPSTNGSGSQVFKSDLHIVSVNGTGSAIGVLTASANEQHPLSQSAPQPGYEYVRIGSTTEPDRQGSIYLTADDDNAPFIDVVDGLTAHSQFNTSGKVKVRMGKLSGIGTTTFGTLPGYGFYASGSAFLEGSINATSGSIGDFIIDNTEIRDNGNLLRLKSGGQITASRAFIGGDSEIAGWNVTNNSFSKGSVTIASSTQRISLGTITDFDKDGSDKGILMGLDSGDSYEFFVGKEDGDFIHFDGNNVLIKSDNLNITASDIDMSTDNFELDAAGLEISSTRASMSLGEGKIILSGSTVPVIKIDGGEISASKFFVDSQGQMTASAGEIGGFEITDTVLKNGVAIVLDSANENLSLADGNIVLDGTSTGFFKIGNLPDITTTSGTTKGILAQGDGDLLIKAGIEKYIQFNGGELDIKTTKATISGSEVNIQTPKFYFGENTNFISGSNGNIQITTGDATLSGSSVSIQTPKVFLGEGNSNFISASNGNIEISSSNFHLQQNGDLTGSSVLFDGGTIGGFTIGETTLTAGNVTIDSSNEQIKLGSGASSNSNTGIFFDSNGTFNLATDSNNFIRKNGTDLEIKSKNTTLSGSNVQILTSNIFLGQGSTNFISASGDVLEISSSNFHLKNGNITASNVNLSGKITATTGEVGGFGIGTTAISSSHLILSSSTTPTDEIISASNFNVKASGQITASNIKVGGGSIGGFTIDGTQIKKLDTNGGVVIDGGTTPNINVRTGSGASTIRTMMGEVSTDRFGFFGFDEGGVDKLFELSNEEQQIAGFKFTQTQLAKNNITMSNANGGKITLNQGTIFLSGSGEGQFANGNIKFDKVGNLDITDARLRISDNGGFQQDAFNTSTGKFVDMLEGDGNVKVVAFEDNTIVTRVSQSGEIRDTLVLSASQVSTNMSDRRAGDIYDANKPIFAYNTQGAPLAPLSAVGRTFLTMCDRDNPIKFHFFSPFGDAKVHIASGSNNSGVFDKTLADITVSQSLLTTQLGTNLTPDTNEFYQITSSLPIVVSTRTTNAAGDRTYVPPVSKEVFMPSERDALTMEGTANQTISDISKMYYFSDSPFALFRAGDGTGGDSEHGLPIEMLGDTYVVPHTLADWRIIAVESGVINVFKVNGGVKTLTDTYDISGSKSDPQEITTGSIAGSGDDLFSAQAVRFEGTMPFFLRVNDPAAGDEYPVLGYRRTQTSQYQNSTTIEGNRIRTGKIQSNNFSITAGSEFDLDNATFTLGGSSNPSLNFDGSNLTMSGSSVELLTSKVFLGQGNSNFISASNGNIEISSSNFHLQNNGDVTGSSVLFDGGKIGGWEVTGFQLKSGGSSPNQNISLDATNKQITINSNVFGNTGVQLDYNSGQPQVHIGNAQAGIRFESSKNSLQITSSNVDISGSDVTIQSPKVFLGTGDSNFISASDGNIEISSSNFHLQNNGDLTGSSVLFDGGKIGGFEITDSHISASDLVLKANGELTASNAKITGDITATSGNFTADIVATSLQADSGSIGGFIIGSNLISSSTGGLILKSNGQLTGSAVSMSGTIVTDDITATKGKIGGFTLNNNILSLPGVAGVEGGIQVETGSYQSDASATKEVVYLGQIPNSGHTPGNVIQFSENKFGLSHVYFNQDADLSKVYFEIGHTQNKIAGFEFDEKTIFSGTEISMSSAAGGSITLNNGSIIMSGSGLLNISSSVESPAVIKLNSDGATKGVDIDSTQGIIGHGDITNREFETHNGQFRFTEDSISTDGGNGVTYDTAGDNSVQSTDFNTGAGNVNNDEQGTP